MNVKKLKIKLHQIQTYVNTIYYLAYLNKHSTDLKNIEANLKIFLALSVILLMVLNEGHQYIFRTLVTSTDVYVFKNVGKVFH